MAVRDVADPIEVIDKAFSINVYRLIVLLFSLDKVNGGGGK